MAKIEWPMSSSSPPGKMYLAIAFCSGRMRCLNQPCLGARRAIAWLRNSPFVGQQLLHLLHVAGNVLQPDVLVHADGGDLVELPRHHRIVLQLDRHPVLEAEALDLLPGEGELLLRQRDAVRGDAVVLRRVADEPAPAAADVEEALARLQAQLAADHLQLVALRLRDVVVPVGVVGAGVDHLRIEEERVEVVRQVVVELDVVLVVGGLALAAGDLALKALIVVDVVAARGEERVELPGELQRVATLQLHRAAALVELRAEVDQRAAGKVDALVDVVADEVVERRPAQQRADDAGVGDADLERAGDVLAERRQRAVPQAQRGVEIELAGEFARQAARRLELPRRLDGSCPCP